MNDKEFRRKFDPLFENLRNDEEQLQATLFYASIFMIRRLLLAIAIVFMNHLLIGQIYFSVFASLLVMMFATFYRPFKKRFENNLEILNEVSVLLFSYSTFIFSDFVADPQARFQTGWAFCLLFLSNIVVNLFVLVWVGVRTLITDSRRDYRIK